MAFTKSDQEQLDVLICKWNDWKFTQNWSLRHFTY